MATTTAAAAYAIIACGSSSMMMMMTMMICAHCVQRSGQQCCRRDSDVSGATVPVCMCLMPTLATECPAINWNVRAKSRKPAASIALPEGGSLNWNSFCDQILEAVEQLFLFLIVVVVVRYLSLVHSEIAARSAYTNTRTIAKNDAHL